MQSSFKSYSHASCTDISRTVIQSCGHASYTVIIHEVTIKLLPAKDMNFLAVFLCKNIVRAKQSNKQFNKAIYKIKATIKRTKKKLY